MQYAGPTHRPSPSRALFSATGLLDHWANSGKFVYIHGCWLSEMMDSCIPLCEVYLFWMIPNEKENLLGILLLPSPRPSPSLRGIGYSLRRLACRYLFGSLVMAPPFFSVPICAVCALLSDVKSRRMTIKKVPICSKIWREEAKIFHGSMPLSYCVRPWVPFFLFGV
ncbi:hypothetical protein F5Y06DRAFT_277060 [Hypoxylon sp. FL0890]|nr:hypothetical protein F5Y06DRAFT_277060 [Hypoxylon sp. FL0890]